MNRKPASSETHFLDEIDKFCVKHSLLTRGDTVVVAVSGGVDSMVLLEALTHFSDRYALSLHIAHLNHQLRGPDSDADAQFVREQAQSHGLPCHTKTRDCAQIAGRLKMSIEEACRDVRRAHLAEVAETVGATRIATGHHLDDQAETVLLRLHRGAGTTGLAGIRPRRDVWIRPLLGRSRNQIEGYARRIGLDWRTDASNLDTSIPRNRIRCQLMPILKSDFGSHIPEAIARASEILRDDDDLLEQITLDASKTVICARSVRKIALDGPRFFGYHVAVQRRLARTFFTQLGLSPKRIALDLINRVLAALQTGRSRVQITDDLTASTSGRLIILGTQVPEFAQEIEYGVNVIAPIDASLTVEHVEASAFPSEFADVSRFETWFERSRVPEDLVLRTTRAGDRIRPFGGGTVKVSDLLINRKVPRSFRDEIPVLACRDEVLWVVGIRASEMSRISKTCKRAVHFQFDGSWKHFSKALEEQS